MRDEAYSCGEEGFILFSGNKFCGSDTNRALARCVPLSDEYIRDSQMISEA